MPDSSPIRTFPADQDADAFYVSAYRRIVIFMVALLPVIAALFWIFLSGRIGLSFFIGGVIAVFNFLWLKRLVNAFADRVIASENPRPRGGLASRFLLRYGLVALASYVIFKGSHLSLAGLFAGLTLPAGAILCEAAYQAYTSVTKGI
jgi:ATP synthase I chain